MKTFKELFEVFDHPFNYEYDPTMESLVRHHLNDPKGPYKNHKFGAIRAFKLQDSHGHLIHVVRNGYHELHHIASDNSSGDDPPKLLPPNPRFIGTMLHYAKEHTIGHGRGTKISATPQMFTKLKPIISMLSKRYNYNVSFGEEVVSGHMTHHAIITVKPHPLFEGMKIATDSA
jgi:hypothetical protein